MSLARRGGAAHPRVAMGLLGHIRAIAAGALGLLFASNAAAQCIDAPDLAAYQTASPEDFAQGATRSDRLGRVVAPVRVNGQGPFRFIVDTGANRSAVSNELASRLGLIPNGSSDVHSVHGVSVAPLVNVDRLQYGEVSLNASASSLPMLGGNVLAGEHGLLGVDGMSGRRLRMDFERNCIEIVQSAQARRLRGWSTLEGDMRFGHLMVVRGSISGIRVQLLIDTGSDSSLANVALRDALNARLRRQGQDSVAYTAGSTIALENAILVSRMTMGELVVRNITAYVGDYHIFQLWGLTDEPALLLGMDVLSQARGLAIDYGRGTVHLQIDDRMRLESSLNN